MTLGIQPDAPHTGYGYIQFESDVSEIKRVRNFTEKPGIETAQQFLSSGDYLWNAGIFVWSVQSILKAFRELLPEMYELFDEENQLNTEKEVLFIEKITQKQQISRLILALWKKLVMCMFSLWILGGMIWVLGDLYITNWIRTGI